MGVTLRQIAQQSGVSVQTVSRILRGEQSRHHPATCERVMAAADQLNYRPNLLGRALQSGKTHTVGLLRLGVGDRQQAVHLYGMSSQAKAAGYQLLVTIEDSYVNDGDKDFLRTVDELIGRRVDGLLIHRSVPLAPATRRYIASLDVPVVYSASWAPPKQAHHVKVDRLGGMKRLVALLKGLGHSHVAFFPSPGAMDFPGHHVHPMQRICNEQGLELDMVTPDERFAKMTAEELWTHDSVTRYLKANQAGSRATGLIFPGADGVHGGRLAIAQAGLSVPDDVSVVASEDSSLSQLSNPGITALHCDWEAYGRQVFDLLLNVINQPDKEQILNLIDLPMIVRGSTGPVHKGATLAADV